MSTAESVPTAKQIIANLQSPESKVKGNSFHFLPNLVESIGQERFRKEMVPYVINCIDEEDDESLIELAKIYNKLLNCVGGKNYVKDIIPILEILLYCDDQSVRTETLNSFQDILKQINFSDIEKEIFEIAQKLANSTDINLKISSVDLISIIYKYLTKDKYKKESISYLYEFLKLDNSMMKITIAKALKKLSKDIERSDYEQIFNTLLAEKSDTIRINLMDSIENLQDLNSKITDYGPFLTTVIPKLANDESWRVRLTCSDKFPCTLKFTPLLSNNTNNIRNVLIDSFAKLLEDNEAEVLNLVCQKLEPVSEVLGQDENFTKILEKFKNISANTFPYVRKSLADNILRVCPHIPQKKTTEFIFPIFSELIKDEDFDIRMILIKNLDKLNTVISVDTNLQGIIPSLIEVSNSKNWRTKKQVAETIPVLAKILNKKTFMENIFPICLRWLTDCIYIIRESACSLMKELYVINKSDELEKKLLNKMSDMLKHENYLTRITLCSIIKDFESDEKCYEFLENKLFNFIVKLAKDKVANVRVNAAILLKRINKKSKNKEILKQINSLMEELKKDKDVEVVNVIVDN